MANGSHLVSFLQRFNVSQELPQVQKYWTLNPDHSFFLSICVSCALLLFCPWVLSLIFGVSKVQRDTQLSPPTVPYALPFFGHALSFALDMPAFAEAVK